MSKTIDQIPEVDRPREKLLRKGAPALSDQELLAGIFRCIHTVKGTCGFLSFGKLESVAHVGENLLSRLRDGRIGLTDERATALLKMVDAVRACVL